MTPTRTATAFIGTCLVCRTFVRTTDVRNISGVTTKKLQGQTTCPTCTHYQSVDVFVIVGKVTLTPCSVKCTDAKGVKCDCQCGGDHHSETAA